MASPGGVETRAATRIHPQAQATRVCVSAHLREGDLGWLWVGEASRRRCSEHTKGQGEFRVSGVDGTWWRTHATRSVPRPARHRPGGPQGTHFLMASNQAGSSTRPLLMTCSACCSRLIWRPRLVRPPNMRSSSLAPSPAERRNDDMSLTQSRALHTTAVTRRLPFSHTRTDRRARGSDEGCAFRGVGPASEAA